MRSGRDCGDNRHSRWELFFQPTSLSGLGGIKVFVQATAPTQPPAIPVNSIWLQTSGGIVIGFSTWNGSAWVAQQFNANDVIAVGTIVANLIAAGTVVAGIINGTTVTGATINGSVFNGTNWIENSSGQFLYSGTPAAGNLVASIAPTSGTDGFGNAYQSGFTVYGTSGAMTQVVGTAGSTAIKMTPSGAVHVGFTPQMEAGIANAGLANEILQTIIRSGSPDGTTANSSAIVLDAPAADGSTIPSVQLFIGNGNGLAVNSSGGVLVGYPVSIATTAGGTTAEAWNPATTVNGWTSTSLKYKRQATNSVRVLGVIDPAAQTNTTFFTLPAGYRPATTQDHSLGYHTATAPTQGVFIRASTSGTLAALNSSTTSGVLVVDVDIPLDY